MQNPCAIRHTFRGASGRRIGLSAAFSLVWLIAPNTTWADVDSGPAVGDRIPKLNVHAVTGPEAGKSVDVAEIRGEKLTVYVFVPAAKWSRPAARFLKQLDAAIKEKGGDAAVVAVWLTDTPAVSKDYLPRAQQSLKFDATWLSVDEANANGPNAWTINSEADITVVVAPAGKVKKTFGFVSVNETLVKSVTEELGDDSRTE